MKRSAETFKIINKLGLHARAAALFVKEANSFKAEVHVYKGKKKVNGKSIMGLLMLAAGRGSQLKIEAVGADGEEAVKVLGTLIAKGFYEQ